MKKVFLTLPIIILLAAGCNQSASVQTQPVPTTQQNAVKPTEATTSQATSKENMAGDTLNLKTYSDSQLGFSFQYPKDWTVEQSKGSADTVESVGFYLFNSNDRKVVVSISRNADTHPSISSHVNLLKTESQIFNSKWTLRIVKDKESGIEYNENWTQNGNITYAIESENKQVLNDVVVIVMKTFKFTK